MKNFLNKVKRWIKHPEHVAIRITHASVRLLPDVWFLKAIFRLKLGYRLNIEHPKTFNEKLQWLKLNNRNKDYVNWVDKYEVKAYVSSVLGSEYIIPTLGIYNSFDEINFADLPDKFVIKTTHHSGGVIVCQSKEKLDFSKAKQVIESKLRSNLYYHGLEWPYKYVKPRVIVEQLLESEDGDLNDYKFFCFGGKVHCFKIDFDRFTNHKANYYSRDGQLLPFGEVVCPPDFNRKLKFPEKLNEMIECAERLAKGIPFVRIDFYSANRRIYLGEITFYPASGLGPFIPDSWDEKLGNLIDLNNL